jgi:glycosyltransferase involved in cell wall biosynthesis
LTRWKGQLVLIDAMAKLAREKTLGPIHAVMIGDAQGRDDYTRELRAAIASHGLGARVTIANHVSDMPAAYLAADVVVSASIDPEAFGRVIAEASAMGRPVIATNHGGSRETVLPNETGVLTPAGDFVALAEAMKALVAAGPYWRKQMGERGRAYIASRFTTERMCAETIALYRELLAQAV